MDLIDQYRAHLIDLDRSQRTITDYEAILRRMDRELPHGLTGANSDELKAWIWSDGRGPATRLMYRTIVGGFFAWAVAPPDNPNDPWLDYDPARALPRPRKPRRKPKPVTSEQLGAILAQAGDPHRLWFLLAAYAGLRCVEISRMDRAHITADQVWVRAGKGDRERYVPTHPVLWRAVAGIGSGPVAVDRDGLTRLNPQQVAHRGNHVLRNMQAGASMHRLRHWFGTTAYARSRDVLAVRDLMGHSAVTTTQLYVDIADDQRRRTVDGLPDLT